MKKILLLLCLSIVISAVGCGALSDRRENDESSGSKESGTTDDETTGTTESSEPRQEDSFTGLDQAPTDQNFSDADYFIRYYVTDLLYHYHDTPEIADVMKNHSTVKYVGIYDETNLIQGPQYGSIEVFRKYAPDCSELFSAAPATKDLKDVEIKQIFCIDGTPSYAGIYIYYVTNLGDFVYYPTYIGSSTEYLLPLSVFEEALEMLHEKIGPPPIWTDGSPGLDDSGYDLQPYLIEWDSQED